MVAPVRIEIEAAFAAPAVARTDRAAAARRMFLFIKRGPLRQLGFVDEPTFERLSATVRNSKRSEAAPTAPTLYPVTNRDVKQVDPRSIKDVTAKKGRLCNGLVTVGRRWPQGHVR